jgi:rubredoxin
MRCPECDVAHSDWTDRGTRANNDARTTLDLWECERCGYTLEGVRL